MITGNPKYHRTRLRQDWLERRLADLEPDYLPPYSPEFNPIERLWKLTRRCCLHNRYFVTLQEVIDAIEAEFAGWANRNEALRRLCAIS